MKITLIMHFMVVFSFTAISLKAQFLSHLNVTADDALYITYAANIQRSSYLTDQGYQFRFNDGENGIEMVSKDGPNSGLAFMEKNDLRFSLNEMYQKPVVTVSYSDLLAYYFFPFPNIKVEVTFTVYNSQWTICRYQVSNLGNTISQVSLLPYLYYASDDPIMDINHENCNYAYSFPLIKPRDKWMVEHNIPLTEKLTAYFSSNLRFDSALLFSLNRQDEKENPGDDFILPLKRSFINLKPGRSAIKGICGIRTLRMEPGDRTTFSVVIGLCDARNRKAGQLRNLDEMFKVDFNQLLKEDEKDYSHIPVMEFDDKDKEMLYWSSFSLMRQCMMPPEGACHYNYYVFSREPKWGWGYGGQVFHESLAMMAYAYMDPEGAMNSQRVYMERQYKDGYINYRTGPFLNETIETNGFMTSSAPWFNYENLEIFKITGDKGFLKQAYESGKKYYQYFVTNRDSNKNGLCEWGGQAELESVRDARVAVWDKVGWPGNFEGPDLNSMLVKEARSLSEIAGILGNPSDSKHWKKEADVRTRLINEKLWDNETKFYYNVNKKDQSFSFHSPGDLKRKEIIGFLPLWAGVADNTRVKYLLQKMQDPEEFWRSYGIPSLSAKDDYYCPMGYWNGPVWIQWNYLIFKGLLDLGYKKEAADLAKKVLDNMIYHLKKDHVFWEFYSPDEHQAGWNQTYIWAGLALRFLMDGEKK